MLFSVFVGGIAAHVPLVTAFGMFPKLPKFKIDHDSIRSSIDLSMCVCVPVSPEKPSHLANSGGPNKLGILDSRITAVPIANERLPFSNQKQNQCARWDSSAVFPSQPQADKPKTSYQECQRASLRHKMKALETKNLLSGTASNSKAARVLSPSSESACQQSLKIALTKRPCILICKQMYAHVSICL